MKHNLKFYLSIALLIILYLQGFPWADETDLVWSTFLGGQYHDEGNDIAVDNSGNVYVTGLTGSNDFPVSAGAYDREYGGNADVFVAKLNSTGSALDYATFLGGSEADEGYSITSDSSGNAYVTGYTASSDFPATIGAFDTTYNEENDVFVVKLNVTGCVLYYATFLGGSDDETGKAISVDHSGAAYLTGYTGSTDFPITSGAFDETLNYFRDAFIVKLNPIGSTLDYATYLGGNSLMDCGTGIAVDGAGSAYVTGYTGSTDFPTTIGAFDTVHNGESDVFVAKLNSMGDALDYSTYLGGSDLDESYHGGPDIDVDSFGNVYVTGSTYSPDFPTNLITFDRTHNGGGDVFITKLNAAGNTLAYSTFLGGTSADGGCAIVVDELGNAFVTGHTESENFPATVGAFDTTYNGYPGRTDAFVAVFDHLGISLLYATFLGGIATDEGSGIALDRSGNAILTGMTFSSDFPTTSGALDRSFGGSQFHGDAFVTKLGLTPTPVVPETVGTALPQTYTLDQNFPNPFNANTEIRYRIAKNSHVTLKIFNTLGQSVRTLVDGDQRAGEHVSLWDGRNNAGDQAASGLYLCRLKAGNFTKTIKMILIK